MNFNLIMAVKITLRIIIKNHAANQEVEFLKKPTSKPCNRATAMPTAWELKVKVNQLSVRFFRSMPVGDKILFLAAI